MYMFGCSMCYGVNADGLENSVDYIGQRLRKNEEYCTYSYMEMIKCIRMPIIKQLDRAQQIALLTADEAINEIGQDKLKGKYIPVYVAKMMGTEKSSEVNIRIRS